MLINKIMRHFLLVIIFSFGTTVLLSQSPSDTITNKEIILSRDSLRVFFGTFAFSSNFKMKIFSINENIFAQRVGDQEKFQMFSKSSNRFFLKVMPAELEFKTSTKGSYDTLLLHQGGREMKAYRIASQPYELYDTILHLDSLLYASFNNRDLQKFMSYLSPDLEFYHDLTGKTNYQDNLERFKVNFAKSTNIRRELLKGSLEVYPIKDFGAIQIGTHTFYQQEKGKLDKYDSQAKFMHIWRNINNEWQITRIISYDH
jgi:hypothetical protein